MGKRIFPTWADGGGVGPSPDESGVIFRLLLPRTFGSLKSQAVNYGGNEGYNLSDDYEFKRWCIFIPSPFWVEIDIKDDSISKLIFDIRKGFGGLLGPSTLFFTFVDAHGNVNSAISGSVINALKLKTSDAPFFIFTDTYDLKIRNNYRKKYKSFVHTDKLEYVIVKFGKATKDEVRATINKLSDLLSDTDISVNQIELSRFLIRISLAAKNLVNFSKENGKYILLVIIALIGK